MHVAVRPAAGSVRCEVRALGVESGRPRFGAWFYEADRLCAAFVLEEVLLPTGRIGSAPPAARRDFLLGRYVSDVSLARIDADTATLTASEVAGSDWLPGTVLRVYGTESPPGIAARELEGSRLGVHPRFIDAEPVAGGFVVSDRHRPLRSRRLVVEGDTVRGAGNPVLDLDAVVRWWRRYLDGGDWAGERALLGAIRTGLADLVVHDPDTFAALRGRPCLYLANHETYVESVVFCCVVSALQDLPVNALAKAEQVPAGTVGRIRPIHGGVEHSGVDDECLSATGPVRLPRGRRRPYGLTSPLRGR